MTSQNASFGQDKKLPKHISQFPINILFSQNAKKLEAKITENKIKNSPTKIIDENKINDSNKDCRKLHKKLLS